jgi:uncharacterized protein (DUF3084 family)
MTTGYILIAAILILGGVIATVGDRIGTRVGKARLSLFNMRPKKTAVLVTIFTGGLISASTLGILFAADEGLRQGVFELEDIQKDLRNKREQLKIAESEKSRVEVELSAARTEQTKAEQELQVINKSLQVANAKQKATQTQLQRTESRLSQVVSRYQQALTELQRVYEQRETLHEAIAQLREERQRLYAEAKTAIEGRDRKITQLDGLIKKRNQEIAAREQVIATREALLKELEKQQNFLEQEVTRLEKYYQSYRDLRLGKLALVRNQVLASTVVQVDQPRAAREVVIQLLQAANQNANYQLTEPGENPTNKQLLEVTQQRIEQLSQQISDGREYVVRIFSAGNYVRGENQIEFFADAARNQLVFAEGEVLATTTADPKNMTPYQLSQRVDLLISASEFRARNAGIVEGLLREATHLRFFLQLRLYDQPLEIRAIAMEDTYTAGPLRIRLLALLNGKVIFNS